MASTNIRDFREKAGLTLEDLAGETDISVSQLSRIERDERDIRLSELNKIAARFRVRVPDLLPGTATVRSIPLVSWVSAGRLTQADQVMNTDVLRHISIVDLPHGDWIALQVDGDSMDRIARDGAIICVNRDDQRLVDGKFYVFAYDDGEATFKRYRNGGPPRLQPFSTNPDHETIYPSDGLRAIGRVRRVIIDLD